MQSDLVIPKRIQLEVAYGCNAKCTMCPIIMPTIRKKGIMSTDLFKKVIDEMGPYKDEIEKVDLWGLGEPLLDPNLFEKIKYAKVKKFKNIAIATNADLLNAQKQNEILESKLDTVIFSIDGTTKQTHESIRIGVDFDRVIGNAENIIEKRNNGNYSTRFVFRFIRQEKNKAEWNSYQQYWGERISIERNDLIIGYDMHSWGGQFDVENDMGKNQKIDQMSCHHVHDRLIVLWDGTVPLCCSDLHSANYAFGNVKEATPVEVFNNKKINKIRALHDTGQKNKMEICSKCTILNSEHAQEVIK